MKGLSKTLQILVTASTLLLTSCATTQNEDPFEKFNRSAYLLNTTVDTYLVRPLADIYNTAMPNPVIKGVNNFFSNTMEISRIANDLLQGDLGDAASDFGRLAINSTVGILGIFDVATHAGLVKHRNDFGVTLAKWGYTNSAYLVIPLLGPMTVRDSLSVAVDYYALNPVSYIQSDKIRLGLIGLGKVHYRSKILTADKVVNDAFDPYVFVRDAYLQKRRAMIDKVVLGHHAAEDTFVQEIEEKPSSSESEKTTEEHDKKEEAQSGTSVTNEITDDQTEQETNESPEDTIKDDV